MSRMAWNAHINHSQVMTAHLFTDQETRMHAATFCLAPLRDLAGKREYDEALRRIVEMLTPSQQVESTPKAAP